jgi:hypothetical protein
VDLAKQPPATFFDITLGNNILFSNVKCCSATPGFDMASGLGTPLANLIAGRLHH